MLFYGQPPSTLYVGMDVHKDSIAVASVAKEHHAEVISLKGDSYRLKDRDFGRSAAATEDA